MESKSLVLIFERQRDEKQRDTDGYDERPLDTQRDRKVNKKKYGGDSRGSQKKKHIDTERERSRERENADEW